MATHITSTGVSFEAHGGSSVNLLDDYEEGSYTVTCQNSVTLYAASNLASYTKIGRMLTTGAQNRINNDNSDAVLLVNLPLTSSAGDGDSSGYYTGCPRLNEFNLNSDVMYVILYVNPNTSYFEVNAVRDDLGSTAVLADASAYIMWSLTYAVA